MHPQAWRCQAAPHSLKKNTSLLLLCLATVLLVTLEQYAAGITAWCAGALVAARTPDPAFKRRMATLFASIAILALAPINTDRSNSHFLLLGACFTAVVFLPHFFLRRTDPHVIQWAFLPRQFVWRDWAYVAISIPLAWGIIRLYFYDINPDLPTHWPLPATRDNSADWRLILGINGVGIWDELFFINNVYGILRSLYSVRLANLAQAVVYTAVLYDMAFTGIGPVVVYAFALTQGLMYERSRNLLCVLIVHIIVDAFLLAAIFEYFYPPTAGFALFNW